MDNISYNKLIKESDNNMLYGILYYLWRSNKKADTITKMKIVQAEITKRMKEGTWLC